MFHHKRWAAALTAAALLAGMTAISTGAADSVLLSADFEGSTSGWLGFGPASVSYTNNDKHTGDCCLYVSGRSENWNGAFCDMDSTLTAGQSYKFSAWVNGKSGDTIQFMLKYKDSAGEQYKQIGEASGGKWTEISASYDIPSDASGMLIYFQTAEGTNDFEVDDVTVTGQASWSEAALDRTPLKDIYANYFKIGCAATPAELTTPISQEIVKHHFNSLTIGNELKPDYVMDKDASQSSGKIQVSLAQASSLLKFCEENHIPIRGHVFCWYSQTPAWFFKENFSDNGKLVSKDVMNQRLDDYIKAVIEAVSAQYPDLDVYCWDVVNECYLDEGNLRTGGTDTSKGESYWSLVYGDDSYIEQAFTSARKYAPKGTKLFYNDFNEYIPAKRDAIYAQCKKLKEKGLIDGIGMQSHLDVGYPDASLYRQAIDKFDSLGLEVQITELDITDYDSGADSDTVAKAYKDIMAQIVDAKKSGANITACVFWGITDGTSWRKTGYPLLLNADYSPKKAYDSVESAVPESEWGNVKETTTEPPTEESVATTDGLWHAKKGDVYVDNKVDLLDIIYMQKYLHGISKNTFESFESSGIPPQIVTGDPSDLNEDGTCDVFDLALLKRQVMKNTANTGRDEFGQPIVVD
jgi:endo-1,4-beta-xylanase